MNINDDLAEFIAEFLQTNNKNLNKQLIENGLSFLESMKLMMWQKKSVIHQIDYADDIEEIHHKKTLAPHPMNDNNPMPNHLDIITGDIVSMPAMSPYGHVLSYETWIKILASSKRENRCPFTLQKMTRRSLIRITKENYQDYKDQIVNITKEQMDVMGSMN